MLFDQRSIAPNLRSTGKNHMISEQEVLEDRIRRMEESMARMTGFVETLVQNRSQPPLLTDSEQADVLRARRRVNGEDTTAVLEAAGITVAGQDEASGSNPAHEAHNSRRRQTASAQRPAARSRGVRLPTK